MGTRRERTKERIVGIQDGNVLGVIGIRDVMRSLVELIWRAHDEGARETAKDLLRR